MIPGIAEIIIVGGKGGVGAISFAHRRVGRRGPPDGGDGGDGGNVIVVATNKVRGSMAALHGKMIVATDGRAGASQGSTGKRGHAVRVAVPVGTMVWEEDDGGVRRVLGDLTKEAAQLVVAWGGRGGRGNRRFAGPDM